MENIKKNDIVTIKIDGMNHEGQGVGRVNGLTVFVEGAMLNEKVEAKVVKLAKSYAVGKLLNIIEPSEGRAEPLCPSSKRCGGCSLQHMDYAHQLQFKTNLVRDSLKRIGKLENMLVYETIGMALPSQYRNKAQFPVGCNAEGTPTLGFYAKRTHEIIDTPHCMIQEERSDRVRECVREFIDIAKVNTYNETTGKGLIRHVLTRIGFKTNEVMVVIVINGEKLPHQDKLIELLTTKVPEVKSIYLNSNKERNNVILGKKNQKIYGEDTISDYIGQFQFRISPLSFYQVNPIQTEVLYAKALEYAGLDGKEIVFDLYCGIGTISLFLSQKAARVYGIEVVEEAIVDARVNAANNGVANVEFLTGEAEKVVPKLYQKGIKADVVVLDPPRKGCEESLLKTLIEMQPQKIVYVSCNPATLARDLRYLANHGYEVKEVQPVDMFPWTSHVEAVTLLERE